MSSNWADFLEVRKRLIDEFIAEGKSCTEVAQILSMDAGQVWLISDSSRDLTKRAPEDAIRAITKVRDHGIAHLRRVRDVLK